MRKLLVLLVVCLVACSADEAISRNYRCTFIFDTSLHPMPCHLTAILGNVGQFAKVEMSMDQQGVRHLKTTRNFDGATEEVILSTAKESQVNFNLGANNCIIIGTSKYSYDFSLVAYDGQCPNCLNDYNGTSYPLTWEQNGDLLHCGKCDRTYDVNNGTLAKGKEGRGLLTYLAAYDGMVLRAWN